MDRAMARRRSIDWWAILSTVAVASAYALLAMAHFHQWRVVGRPIGLGFLIQESVVLVLLVVRRGARDTSRSLAAWLAAGIGTFGMLGVRPTDDPIAGLGILWAAVQFVGVAGAVTGLSALGRSFGLVAAHRGLRTTGVYSVVRHPIYASYLVGCTGYILENPSLRNLTVLVVVWTCQLLRIAKEEELLAGDPAYAAYRERVRYRLVPFLY